MTDKAVEAGAEALYNEDVRLWLEFTGDAWSTWEGATGSEQNPYLRHVEVILNAARPIIEADVQSLIADDLQEHEFTDAAEWVRYHHCEKRWFLGMRQAWRWDGPNPHPDCECPCDACVDAIGVDPLEPCPYCPVHGQMTDAELAQEWRDRLREDNDDA